MSRYPLKTHLLIATGVMISLTQGCTLGIVRQGYEITNRDVDFSTCRLVIKEQFQSMVATELLGKIESHHNTSYELCTEEYVLSQFIEDGCILGADIINIAERLRPNGASYCYCVKAEFLKLENDQDLAGLTSDPQFAPEAVYARTKKARHDKLVAERQAAFDIGLRAGMSVRVPK